MVWKSTVNNRNFPRPANFPLKLRPFPPNALAMKLSKKAEYAMRALLAMARSPETGTFSIQDIASSERIPLKFLEQILLALNKGGLLRSKRGVGGGYQFQKVPARITLGEVITIIDGPFEPIPCASKANTPGALCDCGIPGGCGLGQTFAQLRQDVNAWLDSTTLAHVLEREKKDGDFFDI